MQHVHKRYTRLSFEEREEVSRGLARGDSFRAIEENLGRGLGTVSSS